jgi:hypothetical protein
MMPVFLKCGVAVLVLMSLLACCQGAKQGPHDVSQLAACLSGKIVGIVRDLDDDPIVNAAVLLRDSAGNVQHETKTDSYGKYAFKRVPPGAYSLCIKAHDYITAMLDGATVSLGKTVRPRTTLVEDPEKVFVIRDPIPMVRRHSTASGVRVWQDDKGIIHVENE